jgi:hypothetical protein
MIAQAPAATTTTARAGMTANAAMTLPDVTVSVIATLLMTTLLADLPLTRPLL